MTVALGAFLLGTAGQQVTSRNVRLSLGATWRPSSAALGALSGVVYGPAGSMGELTLVNPTTVNVNPFIAVIQGTHAATQGQYHVPNDTVRAMASTVQHASQYRRNLIVVTVDDAEAAGVASDATTDRARLHVIEGALNATAPAPLPAVPANSVVLGEVVIPPTGQSVSITPYNPRTVARGGILPVLADTSTLPGHAGLAPAHDGEYRHHPTGGLQVGVGGAWHPANFGTVGRIPFNTAKQNPDTGITAVINLGQLPVAHRVILEIMGRLGFDTVARTGAWQIDSTGGTTVITQDPVDQVNVAAAGWSANTHTATLDVPANTDCLFRVVLRSSGPIYSRGSIIWNRTAQL